MPAGASTDGGNDKEASAAPGQFQGTATRHPAGILTSLATAAVLMAFQHNREAPPAIQPEGVTNAASRIPSQLPSGAVAPGSLVQILGVRLGPEQPGVEGVSVHVRQGDFMAEAAPLHASARRIDAALPPSTPIGQVLLSVTYKGQTSAPFAVKVVPSSFGIFTLNGAGWGPAIPDPAARGDVIVIRGTGLGSERRPDVLVGGRPARVRSAGHSRSRPGEDEIRFQIPKDAPEGCFVPIQVHSERVSSNFATLSIAPKGRPCAPTAEWLESGIVVLLLRMRLQLAATVTVDVGTALSGQEKSEQRGLLMLPPVGRCAAYAGTFTGEELATFLRGAGSSLDAGPITITGPLGTKTMGKHPRGPFSYWNTLGGTELVGRRRPEPLFFEPGSYSITGAGNSQAPAFRMQATIPTPIEWTNADRLASIDRARGFELTWKGATADDLMAAMAMNVDQTTGAAGLVACVAPGESGRIFVPARLLENMPLATGPGIFPLNLVALARFSAQRQGAGWSVTASASLDVRSVDFR